MKQPISRRLALHRLAGGTALLTAAPAFTHRLTAADQRPAGGLKGNIRQSVCRWCYNGISLENLCRAAQEMGIQSIDLLTVDQFPVLKKYGLICAMVSGIPGGIRSGFNRLENHDRMIAFLEHTCPIVARHGFPNIICFSGNRRGMDDEQGLENCVIGLKRVAPIAEKHKVTICMELLNSKVDHHDYMCDHSRWGAELVKRVGSERFKLLYDIYHMQIMEGDIIRTIRDHHDYFGHYHTGGIPGRHLIDNTQELYYPAVMRAIVATGFKGFVAQEFVPRDKAHALDALRKAVAICDV